MIFFYSKAASILRVSSHKDWADYSWGQDAYSRGLNTLAGAAKYLLNNESKHKSESCRSEIEPNPNPTVQYKSPTPLSGLPDRTKFFSQLLKEDLASIDSCPITIERRVDD